MDGRLITFYRSIPGALKPRRADKSAAGTLPTRAHRYCEPVRLASALGYYVFLPMTFQIEWDGGQEAVWSYDEGVTWYPLVSAAYPDSMAAWDAAAPDFAKGYCPPFVSLTQDANILQIWTGWFARTAPGYSLLIRSPANLTPSIGYHTLEGIIETDRWFGPLFTNVRMMRSEAPIRFDGTWPFLQVQPIHRDAYDDRHLDNVAVEDAIAPHLWVEYEKTLIRPVMHEHERGHYAKVVRRRRAEDQ